MVWTPAGSVNACGDSWRANAAEPTGLARPFILSIAPTAHSPERFRSPLPRALSRFGAAAPLAKTRREPTRTDVLEHQVGSVGAALQAPFIASATCLGGQPVPRLSPFSGEAGSRSFVGKGGQRGARDAETSFPSASNGFRRNPIVFLGFCPARSLSCPREQNSSSPPTRRTTEHEPDGCNRPGSFAFPGPMPLPTGRRAWQDARVRTTPIAAGGSALQSLRSSSRSAIVSRAQSTRNRRIAKRGERISFGARRSRAKTAGRSLCLRSDFRPRAVPAAAIAAV